jgi:small subunit ribosomal protein S17
MTNTNKKTKKEAITPEHGSKQRAVVVGTRGRTFEGFVTKKFPTRVVVEFERTVYVRKYQRFYKKKTRLHARTLEGMHVDIGDYIRVHECRPLSKIICFVVVEKIRAASEMAGKKPVQSTLSHGKIEKIKEAKR